MPGCYIAPFSSINGVDISTLNNLHFFIYKAEDDPFHLHDLFTWKNKFDRLNVAIKESSFHNEVIEAIHWHHEHLSAAVDPNVPAP